MSRRKSKSYRNINVDGEIWRWKVGSGSVSIRDPENKHHFVNFTTLTGIEDTERASWKGYLHIQPKHVRNYIDVHLRERFKTKIDIMKSLKNIFYKKKSAHYLGGTLVFNVNVDNSERFVSVNVGDGKDDDEKCWIALNYIKNKGYRYHFYKTAIDIVSKFPKYKKLLSIALLKEEG